MKPKTRGYLIGGVIGVVLGIAMVMLIRDARHSSQFSPFYFIATYLLAVLVHELGHALAGWMLGFELVQFAVWPVQLCRPDGRWRIERFRTLFSGQVVSNPVAAENLRLRLLWMIAAGPAASLLAGLLALVYRLQASGGTSPTATWLAGLFMVWSLAIGLAGLLPIPGPYAVSDGLRIRMLRRGGPEAERACCLLQLEGSARGKSRPRDWNSELIERACALDDDTNDALAAFTIRYNWLFDLGRMEEAGQMLDRILKAERSGPMHAIWQLEGAWFEARFRGDAAKATAYLVGVANDETTPAVRCARAKAEAGIALLEERYEDSAMLAQAGLKECERMPKSGLNSVVAEQLRKLLEEQPPRAKLAQPLPDEP